MVEDARIERLEVKVREHEDVLGEFRSAAQRIAESTEKLAIIAQKLAVIESQRSTDGATFQRIFDQLKEIQADIQRIKDDSKDAENARLKSELERAQTERRRFTNQIISAVFASIGTVAAALIAAKIFGVKIL